ncbi:MAG TPA: hypothetical protein VER03_23855 [Bryobacteraceae bacterium]|nr:hypothetical protein [Bryobacteraceae bacterium]
MKFIALTVQRATEEVQASTGFAVRVLAELDTAPSGTFPFSASVGAQPLEGLRVVQSLQPMLSGYLATTPQPGDELVITIDDVAIPTGLTVDDPPIA